MNTCSLNPNPNLSSSFISQSNRFPTQIQLQPKRGFSIPFASSDSLKSVIQNPAISTSYRNENIPKPNQTVLDAQARICTGPTQTKPLNEEQARKVLDTILKSVSGELKGEEVVSGAQLGAFFAAMTIRANSFPEATQWSEGERHAMHSFWPTLVQVLPPDVIFLANPDGLIMGQHTVGPRYVGNATTEFRLVSALREVLQGGHLGFEDVEGILRGALPLEERKLGSVSDSLLSAFLIGQRMNRETDSELQGYCLAFDNELGPPPVADVKSLTHYGEPYDGNTRYFRSTLFVAAVRACYGESCLLHGVDWMPPKGGITEEQILRFMGANTHLSPLQAKNILEDEEVGFAYLSQREACPSYYSLVTLRDHIKKRPPLATTEKVQQFVRARGREAILAGFYHEGYEDPLLMLMRRRGVHSGLVIKGEEGALSMTTREKSLIASKGLPVNYCSRFRVSTQPSASVVDGGLHEKFSVEINAKDYGFEPTDTPRTDRSVTKNIKLGLEALQGRKGPAYDRILLNAGMVDHLLGCDGADDIQTALDRAREAIDSGLKKLAWEFITKKKQWAIFMQARFYKNGKPIQYYKGSSTWRGIKEALQSISLDITWLIGSNSKLSLWHDNWTGIGPLSAIAATPNSLLHTINSTVGEYIVEGVIQLPREIKHIIDTAGGDSSGVIVPMVDCPDEPVWEGAANGIVTVRGAYHYYRDREREHPWMAKLWQRFLPPKISVLLWRISHDRLPTQWNRLKCGLETDGLSVLCNDQRILEDQDHFLLHCQYAAAVWSWIEGLLQLDLHSIRRVKQLLRWCCKWNLKNQLHQLMLDGNYGSPGIK